MFFVCTVVLTRIIFTKIWATFLYVTCSLCVSPACGLCLRNAFFGCSKNSSSVRHNTTDWPNQLAAQWDYVTLERLAWRSRARVYLCSKRRLKKDTLSAAQCIVVPVKSCNKWCFCSMVYQVMSFLSSSVQSYVIGSTCPTAVRVFSWSDKRTSPGRRKLRSFLCMSLGYAALRICTHCAYHI